MARNSNTTEKAWDRAGFRKVGIVGLGLIGGSLAKALRTIPNAPSIIVADSNPETVRAAIADGTAHASVDTASPSFAHAFDGCDALFICIPPQAACKLIPTFRGADIGIVTDVSSVKSPIMEAAAGMRNFIGGHPMAGSEGSGYIAADASLFRNAMYILCIGPDCTLPNEAVEAFKKLISAIGATTTTMEPELHDCRMATISHLPHVAAFALAGMVEGSHDSAMRSLIGGGFRDTTRIAASSPELWTDIFLSSSHLPDAIEEYIAKLQRVRGWILENNPSKLRAALAASSEFRASIPDGLRAPRRVEGHK